MALTAPMWLLCRSDDAEDLSNEKDYFGRRPEKSRKQNIREVGLNLGFEAYHYLGQLARLCFSL